MARTATGNGYWLVASDGGVFSFGDAHFYGSTGNIRLKKPITGMARSRTGKGYWMVASDGGIFSFGDAHFRGSTGGLVLPAPIKGMASDPVAEGYWMLRTDGKVYSFGHAAKLGSAVGMLGGQAAVGISASPFGGFWIASQWGGVDTASSTGMHIDPNLIPRNGAEAIQFELINRINTERVARNLHPLFIDPLLSSYSTSWARHLASTQTFSHQNLRNDLADRRRSPRTSRRKSLRGRGAGARDAGTAHYALMLSDPHRANILVPGGTPHRCGGGVPERRAGRGRGLRNAVGHPARPASRAEPATVPVNGPGRVQLLTRAACRPVCAATTSH